MTKSTVVLKSNYVYNECKQLTKTKGVSVATHKNATAAGDIEVTEKHGEGVEKPKTKRVFTALAFILPVFIYEELR